MRNSSKTFETAIGNVNTSLDNVNNMLRRPEVHSLEEDRTQLLKCKRDAKGGINESVGCNENTQKRSWNPDHSPTPKRRAGTNGAALSGNDGTPENGVESRSALNNEKIFRGRER